MTDQAPRPGDPEDSHGRGPDHDGPDTDDSPATDDEDRRPAAVPADQGRSGDRSRHHRRRRWAVVGIAAAALLVVVALCVGGVAALSAVDRVTERRADDRQQERTRSTACLDLEQRLNRVSPPGAAADPAGRAAAIRAENAALRPYLGELELRDRSDTRLTWWRQLLDARTAYAEALDRQKASRTPAFFLAPRTPDGHAVADRLEQRSPPACAGAVRRLAAPEL